MAKRNTARLFERRRGHLEYRIKRDYVRQGIATIPCYISNYNDVINPFSVEGYETLTADFYDYLKECADVTPPECPLVLDIVENCLSQDERKTIEEIIRDDFAYDLGMVEMEDKRHTRIFWFMVMGLILSGIVLWLTRSLTEVPRELLFIPFWFMGETLCDYIFLTGADLRRERRLAGRLASIKVIFTERYKAPVYTASEVDKLYSEIEEGVNETILEEK